MRRTSFRRSIRARALRAGALLVAAILTFDILSLVLTRRSQLHRLKSVPNVHGQKIFVASIHWNNEKVLRSNWNDAVIEVVKYFGPENVYISVHESGSWDDSKGALRVLDKALEELRVNRTIILDETTHADELKKPPMTGWIDTPRGRKELRRIPYLSRLRNASLQPLRELATQGVKFDKVLFLNDVVFNIDDVATLLATRDGDYAAACSLDFARPPAYYDTFALRDSAGHEALLSTWPYFRSSESRAAMISGQPVPVRSCWNGIIAFDAAPFSEEQDPLLFRGVSDDLAMHHLEASECCLIHADNPLSSTHGVWLNPAVRVGYTPEAYKAANPGIDWPSDAGSVRGVWTARFAAWFTTPLLKKARVSRRLHRWALEDTQTGGSTKHEPGEMCLINEMQVLIENGWAHV